VATRQRGMRSRESASPPLSKAEPSLLSSAMSVGGLEAPVENAEVGPETEGEDNGEGSKGKGDGERVLVVAGSPLNGVEVGGGDLRLHQSSARAFKRRIKSSSRSRCYRKR
jgi:hypothetical protein